jgi:hypothetical protein
LKIVKSYTSCRKIETTNHLVFIGSADRVVSFPTQKKLRLDSFWVDHGPR